MAKYLGIPLQVASGTTVTPTYGSPELVTNGDFLNSTNDWTPENAATITVGTHEGRSDVADINVTSNAQSRIKQSFDFVNGVKYQITVEVFLVSGSFRVDAVDADAPNDFVSTTTTGSWQTLTGTFTGARTSSGDIFLRGNTAVAQFYVDSISIKEVSYVLGDNQVVDGTFSSLYAWEGTNIGWSTSEGQAIHSGAGGDIKQELNLVVGKTYQATATMDFTGDTSISNSSFQIRKNDNSGSWVQLFNSPALTPDAKKTYTLTFEAEETNPFIRFFSADDVKVSNVLLQEVQYNYLQVVGGDLLKESKVGDVVFNFTDDNEAVVVQVIDNDTLLLSNDVLSDAGDSFSIFAPNGDTRGNQILRVDNYIISEYDEATSLPNKSSFWFAAGPQADKVTLQQLNNAVNTYFVADVIERFIQRLNAQSATASRLDIPLNEFRDHKYNQVLTTTAITLS